MSSESKTIEVFAKDIDIAEMKFVYLMAHSEPLALRGDKDSIGASNIAGTALTISKELHSINETDNTKEQRILASMGNLAAFTTSYFYYRAYAEKYRNPEPANRRAIAFAAVFAALSLQPKVTPIVSVFEKKIFLPYLEASILKAEIRDDKLSPLGIVKNIRPDSPALCELGLGIRSEAQKYIRFRDPAPLDEDSLTWDEASKIELKDFAAGSDAAVFVIHAVFVAMR